MWIERLSLGGIGPFREEREFVLTPGTTLLRGGNESGKTTVARTAAAVFFGFPASPRVHREEGARGEILFHLGERAYRLTREFDPDRVRLAEEPGEVLFEGGLDDPGKMDAYRRVLDGLLGADAEGVWRRAGLVEDGALATRLDDAVRAWLSGNPGGRHDTVVAELERELSRVEGADGKGAGGELAGIREELAAKRSEFERGREGVGRLLALLTELEEREGERSAAESVTREREDTLQNLVRFEHLTRERERLENVLVELRDERDRIRGNLETQEQARALLESEYADFLNAPEDVEEGIQTWIEAAQRVQTVDRELERVTAAMAEVPRARTLPTGIAASVGLGLLAWLAAIGAGAPKLAPILIPVFAGAGFFLAWVLGRNADRVHRSHEEETRRLEKERADAAAIQEGARKLLGKLADYDNPAVLRRQFRGYMDLQEKLERSRRGTSVVRPLSEVMDAYEEVMSELQVLDTETRDLVAAARYLSGMDASPRVLGDRMDGVRRDQEQAEAKSRELEERVVALRKELEGLDGCRIAPGRLGEDIAALETRERELLARGAALRTAVETLRDAVSGYQEGHLDRVASRASALLDRLTGGRYSALRFDRDLAPQVKGDDGWVGLDRLSRGAADQIHFALRASLCEDGEPGRTCPLILDEPFRGWDDARLDGAREVLERLAEGDRQCVVLSSDPRLRAWEWATRSLDGTESPSAVQRRAA
jgi:DNA repair exonuclease SbcCD ATPase subunit